MQSTIKPSLIALILLPGQVLAAGFQLAEQSATGMGRAFAGEAAIADNASVLARNAAAMTRFERTAFSGGVIHIQPDVNIEGLTRVPTAHGPVTLDARASDIADGAWVPNAYLILPLNEQWWLGLAATSYYGLGVQMPDNYNAGHFGNVSDIKTVDLGASLAYRINRNWSIGAGLSAIHGEGEVGGTFPSNNKIAKHLKGDGWALGWHLGTLLELSPATRIGLSYRLDPKWQLRSGLAYDRSPVPADRRTISIPDSDRVWYSAGVGYQIDRNLSLDLGLTLIDGKKVEVNETMQLRPGMAQTTSTFQGTSEGDAWLAGLQLNYLF